MRPPTPRQQALLRFIAGYQDQHGKSPSIRTCAEGVGLASTSGIHRLLCGLEERGHIRRDRFGRTITVIALPVIPRAPDGAPLFFVPLHDVETIHA